MHLLYFLFGLVLVGPNAYASPLRTTYQAKIIKPDGYPLQAASVNFRFTILDPSASCVLYVEDFAAINMTDSAGLISFSLGSGVRSFPTSGTAATFANVFNNATTSYSCQTPGIYTPAPNDNRKVVMQFQDSAGWQTLPAMIINAVPYAMYAWKADNATLLNGKADSAFVQYSTIPTCTASQALQYNGASFQCITAGGGGASYTVTANDVTNALGYTPVNSVSYTTVTSTVDSLNSSMTTITSQVNNLTTSMAAMTSSQWTTLGSTINYSAGQVGIGTNAPSAALEVSGGVKLSGTSATLEIPVTSANAGYMTMGGELLLHAKGDYNIYLGRSAGNLTSNGTQNTGIGHHALKDITNGYENVALGDFTMAKITTGGENTALGSEALSFSVSGSRNVAVGIQALMHNSSDENTVVGSYALNRTGNGSNNTGMGYAVMNMLTSGSNNVGAGWMALRNVTTGNSNIAIGYNAGSSITTGSGNVIIGGNTGATFATGSNNISINDGVGNERIRVLSSGNVGIGTTTAVTKLDVSGGVRISMEAAACAVNYAGTLRYNTGSVEFCNGTSWTALSVASNGPLQMSAGTVSSPGISVTGDSDTGIYSSGANSISLVASGSAGVTLSNDIVDLVGAVQVDPWTMYSQVPMQINGAGQDPGYSFANGPSVFSPSLNVLSLATGGSERLRINPVGYVGIGTNNPISPLDVSGTIRSSLATDGNFLILQRTSQRNHYIQGIGQLLKFTSDSANTYDFQLDASNRNIFMATGGGNVGMGTSAPTGRLNIVKASADTSQANAAVNIGSTANPTSLSMGMYDSNYAWIQTFATPLYINALGNNTVFNRDGGNVGVGVEAPVAKLQVNGEFSAGSTQTLQGNSSNKRFLIGDSNSYLNSGGGSNRAYIFGHGNTIDTGGSGSRNIYVIGQGVSATSSRIAMGLDSEHFTILPSGNVGVGATNPGAKLEVGGQIKITGGSPAAGRYLASDASGLGTWTAFTSATVTSALGYTPVASGSISGSQWTSGSGGIYYNSGWVGIGTSTLKVPLSINYDSGVYNASYTDVPNYAGAVITASGAAETAAQVTKPVLVLSRPNQGAWSSVARFELGRYAINAGSAKTMLNIKLSENGISNEGENAPMVMSLQSSGNVGIGTTTPASKLEVAGTIHSSSGGFKFPDGSTQTTAGGPVTWSVNSNNNAYISSGTPGGVIIGRGAGASSVNLWVTTTWGGNDPATNNTGTYNVGLGPGTLTLNTSGSNNTMVGSLAGIYNTTGSYNTALGTLAFEGLNGGVNTGSYNTAIGYQALLGQVSGTAGSRNIALGYQAGTAMTTGSNNVIIGSNSGSSIATLSNNIIIADGSGNNRIHVDSAGEVGIGGTTTPGTSLEIKAKAATGGVNMVTVTDPVLTLNKVGAGDSSAIRFSNNGTMVWALGDLYGSSFNLWNAAASTYNFTVTASGNVGIANSTPSYKLDVSGDLRITGTPYRNGGDSAWIVPSDARLKDVSGKYNRGLREIANIETIYFNYKKDNAKQIDSSVTYTGVLAQEVQKQIPEAVKEDKEGFLSLNTTPIFWAMLNAIKELYNDFLGVKEQVRVTASEVQQLKTENAELKQQNKAIKDYLCAKDPSAPICK